MNKLLLEFKERGFFYQCTSEEELSTILNAFDLGTYRVGFNKIKSIANQLLLQKI